MSGYLIHYASEYYDPVKAHEYYEKHKKLKGRRSTSSLNEEGKYAAEYLKEQVNAKRDKAIEAEKINKENRISGAQAIKDRSIDSYSKAVNATINRLQARMKHMSSAEKTRNYETLNNEIEKLRADNKAKKAEFQARFGVKKADIQGDYNKNVGDLKAQYDNLYLDELDKIKSEAKYQRAAKQTKSKTKSRTRSTNKTKGDVGKYRKDHRDRVGVSYN